MAIISLVLNRVRKPRQNNIVKRQRIIMGLIQARNAFLDIAIETEKPLHRVEVSAGFALQDICDYLGLTEAEKHRVMDKHYVE